MKLSATLLALPILPLAFSLTACGGGNRHHSAFGPGSGAVNPALEATAQESAQAASVKHQGIRQGEILRGATYGDKESVDFRVAMDSDHCYWIGGAANERLGLYLFDPKGKRVESRLPKTNDALLEYCPSSDGLHRLETKLHRKGELAVAVYVGAKPEPVAAPVAAAGPTLEEMIAKEAAAAAPGATQVGTMFEGSVDETTWSTALEAGKCYWFIGAGQTGKVKRLALYVWDPKSSRITQTKAESNIVTSGHCSKETGMYRFQAKVTSGSGPYKVAVYVAQPGAAPPKAAANDEAAGDDTAAEAAPAAPAGKKAKKSRAKR